MSMDMCVGMLLDGEGSMWNGIAIPCNRRREFTITHNLANSNNGSVHTRPFRAKSTSSPAQNPHSPQEQEESVCQEQQPCMS